MNTRYQILKSSSMLGLSATNVFRSLVKSEMNAFSSKSVKLRYVVVICLFWGILELLFRVKLTGKWLLRDILEVKH